MSDFMHSLLWEVTDHCNLRCKHCYNADKYFRGIGRPPGSNPTLNTDECLSVVDRIADIEFDHIHFLGGEPLHRSDIVDIIARARERGLRVTINTNGTFLDHELNAKLVALGVAQVTVSLDGHDEVTNDSIRGKGVFRKVTGNIHALAEQVREAGSDLMVQMAFVATKNNLESILKIPALAAHLGVELVNIMWMYEYGNARKHLNQLQTGFDLPQEYLERVVVEKWRHYPQVALQLESRPRLATYLSRKHGIRVLVNPATYRCVAGEFWWLLEADGHIHPCGLAANPFPVDARSSGACPLDWINVRDIGSFDELPRSEYWQRFLQFRDDPQIYAKLSTCRDCEHNDYCRPCPIFHFASNQVGECLWVIEREAELRASTARALPRANPGARMRRQEENAAVWDPRFEAYRDLNPTAADIWSLVDGKRTCGEIADTIAELYREAVPMEQARRDALHFLLDLRSLDILYFELDCVKNGVV